MDLEAQIRDAVLQELDRQAAESGLTCDRARDGRVRVNGEIDLEALSAVIAGALAGGP